MSINEGLGTTIKIRVMEHCDWINLERKKTWRWQAEWNWNDQSLIQNFWATYIFSPAMLLRVPIAAKARIAYHWVNEKKSYITLHNQWRSCNFDKLGKEESSLSYRVAASCELGEVARKMLGMGGRNKDRVENCTIIFGIQFMMLWAPGEYRERQEIVWYNPSRINFWQ